MLGYAMFNDALLDNYNIVHTAYNALCAGCLNRIDKVLDKKIIWTSAEWYNECQAIHGDLAEPIFIFDEARE